MTGDFEARSAGGMLTGFKNELRQALIRIAWKARLYTRTICSGTVLGLCQTFYLIDSHFNHFGFEEWFMNCEVSGSTQIRSGM
jgi:hypothetical protein